METEIKSFTELSEDVRKAERALEEARQRVRASSFTAMYNSIEINRQRAEADRAKTGLPYCGVLSGPTAEAKLADKSNDTKQKKEEAAAS